jgi:hypothetical protein
LKLVCIYGFYDMGIASHEVSICVRFYLSAIHMLVRRRHAVNGRTGMSLILSYGRVRTQHDDFEWTIVTKMASDGLLIGSRHMVSTWQPTIR